MGFFTKKQDNMEAPLSQEAAKQMLSNVFEACEYEANIVPLEVLQSYSNYRRERHLLQKGVILLVVLLFLLLPVLFITAELDVSWLEGTPPGSPVVQMAVKAPLPIESITASMDGFALEVYQAAEGMYQIHPNRNGTLLITVTLSNKQYTKAVLTIDNVDVTPPELLNSELVEGELEIFFTEDSGELDYENIYAVDREGNIIHPLRCNRETMSVVFAYPESNLNILVPDKCKNTLQLVLTVQ